MKILLVTQANAWVRSISTVEKYVAVGRRLGHDVSVYGEADPELPTISFTTDTHDVDLALFICQVATDFPDMPYLARLLDSVPRERRVVLDLWGRFNDTIRVDHDFNHLEKLDGHPRWEWEEAFHAVSDRILQPTLKPLRPEVGSFLFHGYEPRAIVRDFESASEAADAWRSASEEEKPYGIMYVGSNWQRWGQVRSFLEDYAGVRDRVGRACLIGWDWAERPEWAIEQGINGVDTDAEFLRGIEADAWDGCRFDDVKLLFGKGKFAPVFHRPLFQHLGLVTVRTFETFYADTMPVLMLPSKLVEAIYGSAALTLVPSHDLAGHLADALDNPEKYWNAVLETRAHLAAHHSFERRFEELGQNLNEHPLLRAAQ